MKEKSTSEDLAIMNEYVGRQKGNWHRNSTSELGENLNLLTKMLNKVQSIFMKMYAHRQTKLVDKNI